MQCGDVSACCLCFWSRKGHYSRSALTVVRWPMCDCRDNPYQRLLATVLLEQGFVCFGSTGVRTRSPLDYFPRLTALPN